MIEQFAMIKILKKISINFLNKKQKHKIIYLSFYSLLIPFLEIISIASVSGLVLVFIDFEASIKIIPSIDIQNKLLVYDKIFLLKFSATIVFIAILAKNIIIYFYHFIENRIMQDMIVSNTYTLFEGHLNLKYSDHLNINSAEVQNDILMTAKHISTYIFQTMGIIKDFAVSLLFIITLLLVNFQATFIIIVMSLIIGLVLQKITSRTLNNYGNQIRFLNSCLIKIVQAISTGIKSIIIFSKKNYFKTIFFRDLNKKKNIEFFVQMTQKIPRIFLEVIFSFFLVVFIILFVKNPADIQLLLPYLVFFALTSIRLIPLFSSLSTTLSSIKFLKGIIEPAIIKFEQIKNSDGDDKVQMAETNRLKFNDKKFILKNILIENLSFNYPGSKNILKNINISFKINKIYCIVGETGCGKSTLLDLILGLLNPSNGRIIINNDTQLFENNNFWFGKISYVPQEPFLINETLRNNICFGENNSDISNAMFKRSLTLSCLNDLNAELENKRDHTIGDRGIKISGGQKQRVGFARAMYVDRSLIALDEATSALDSKTEDSIFENIKNIKQGKIIIIITHGDRAILNCDEVIWLKNGHVKFIGKPEAYFSLKKI